MWHPDKPYNDLPALPPKQDLESKDILKQCIKARSSLARLDQTCKLIPNQTILVSTLLLLEAKDSSEIENIVTTMLDVLQNQVIEESEQRKPDKEVLRYREAIMYGFEQLQKGIPPRHSHQQTVLS